MIGVKDLFVRTRMFAGDLSKTKYDDFEVVTAINASLDMLTSALVLAANSELMRRVEIILDENAEAELPEDFRALVNLAEKGCTYDTHSDFFEQVQPEYSYRIEGNKLILPSDKADCVYRLVYHKFTGNIELEDILSDKTVELDAVFLNTLVAMSKNILAGELDAAEEKAQKAVADSRYNKRGAIFNPPMWCGRVSNK